MIEKLLLGATLLSLLVLGARSSRCTGGVVYGVRLGDGRCYYPPLALPDCVRRGGECVPRRSGDPRCPPRDFCREVIYRLYLPWVTR